MHAPFSQTFFGTLPRFTKNLNVQFITINDFRYHLQKKEKKYFSPNTSNERQKNDSTQISMFAGTWKIKKRTCQQVKLHGT